MSEHYEPNYSVVDFAHEILHMNNKINKLERELEHYKELDEMNRQEMDRSMKHNQKITGMIVTAALDPNSALNS